VAKVLNDALSPIVQGRPVRSVLGDLPYTDLGVTDGHNHVWIDPVSGADSDSPVLNQFTQICEELKRYHWAGGRTLLDCQPGSCGRNGNQLIQLSKESGVNIIACTGFHRSRYYPPDTWLFHADPELIADHFIKELLHSMEETEGASDFATAGFIKTALEAEWDATPHAALLGAAIAARKTGALVMIHTEKGALAEEAVRFFEKSGVTPVQLVISHIDKRPNFKLHVKLASAGVLLEYDTFYRPQYQPEIHLWPLIQRMVEADLGCHIVLATDMADSAMYRTVGNGPGLESLPGEIRERLVAMGFTAPTIENLLGGNIARRLAGLI